MRKLMVWTLTILCFLGLPGCGQPLQQPPEAQIGEQQETPVQETEPRLQMPEDRSQPVVLTAEAEAYISRLVNSCTWQEDTAHCEDEYLFSIDGRQLLYHDVCGTFRDPQSNQAAWIPPASREKLHSLLGHETPSPLDTKYNVELTGNTEAIHDFVSPSYAAGETVSIQLYWPLHHVLRVYINGDHMPLEHGKTFTTVYLVFTMPCEDIQINVELVHLSY